MTWQAQTHPGLGGRDITVASLTILLRSSDEEDDFRSRCWHGDFCGTFTLVREPGREAGGVAERPVVEPEMRLC